MAFAAMLGIVPHWILPRDIWLSLKVLCIGPRRA